MAMDQAMEPVGEARSDHDILRGIAAEMGVEAVFTEGRSPEAWQRWLHDVSRQQAARAGVEMPGWEAFQQNGWFRCPERPTVMIEAFRAGPEAHPLATPSGRMRVPPFGQAEPRRASSRRPSRPRARRLPRRGAQLGDREALGGIERSPRSPIRIGHRKARRARRVGRGWRSVRIAGRRSRGAITAAFRSSSADPAPPVAGEAGMPLHSTQPEGFCLGAWPSR